ncbi:DNA alkylation repair enzyme [Agromyces sp. CF514]|nr:DNA alkylation repair enzyme [Agromyces sp. CF514]
MTDAAGPTHSEAQVDATALIARLEALASAEERQKYTRYFPPDESAPFIGVRMGQVFDLAKTALDLPAADLEALLEVPTHEVRALACSIMGKSAAHRRTSETRRHELYELYLRRHDRIDQWDLVDLAARDVVGGWLLERDRAPLRALAASDAWPERRTALVATFAFLKRGELDDAYAIADVVAADSEPYVAKALGWVLRTAGDVDRDRLTTFLEPRTAAMPRIALRAALEHYDKPERTRILAIA